MTSSDLYTQPHVSALKFLIWLHPMLLLNMSCFVCTHVMRTSINNTVIPCFLLYLYHIKLNGIKIQLCHLLIPIVRLKCFRFSSYSQHVNIIMLSNKIQATSLIFNFIGHYSTKNSHGNTREIQYNNVFQFCWHALYGQLGTAKYGDAIKGNTKSH